jgi:hypothetical protein
MEILPAVDRLKVLVQVRRRLDHFNKGGRSGWASFAPRGVRETRYMEELFRVNGEIPREPLLLEAVLSFLELKYCIKRFHDFWATAPYAPTSGPREAADQACDFFQSFQRLLNL